MDSELARLKIVQHERIVQHFGATWDDKNLHIFMELMNGTVRGMHSFYFYMPITRFTWFTFFSQINTDEIRQFGALSEKVALKYSYHVLEGLEFLHSLKLVHRDIKSSNILRDGRGNVKIGSINQFDQSSNFLSINQSINQLVDIPINQSISEIWINQSINQTFYQSINLWFGQYFDRLMA